MKRWAGRRCAVVCASVIVLAGGAACGSDSVTEPASSPPVGTPVTNPAAGPTAPQGAPPAHSYTIIDFIRDNGLGETELHPGSPGAPVVNLPIPEGWADAGSNTPAYAWSAIYFTDPAMSADPPSIITLVSKLTGSAASRVLSYAPGELKNMVDFDGPEGTILKVSGFNAWQREGTFTRPDGARRAIVQTSVVLPAQDGVFILQHNADGLPDQLGLLSDTMRVLNEQGSLTP